jgi:hypothetical protein
MMLPVIAALLLAAPLATQAQPRDPLSSGECMAARAELEAALADNVSNSRARAQRLAAARKQAAVACLGPSSGERERSGAPQPVQVVPPPLIAAPSVPPPAPPPAPPPQLTIPRPAVITTCDPAGCWDSDGQRLNQMGPILMGPRGPCSLQGGVVTCL